MHASIVVGLQFGDEGKGVVTNYLCSQKKADETMVVRFSGGQQAGHTVIHNGIKHIFSNYGSGSLQGIDTYLSEHCTFYPRSMYIERRILLSKGIDPHIVIHPLAKLTTPYDVAYNRVNSANLSHGTCGFGVGATMKRNIESGYKLYAIDTTNSAVLHAKLESIKSYYEKLLGRPLGSKGNETKFEEILKEEMPLFLKALEEDIFFIGDYGWLERGYTNLIFEGSQGILLDMDHGIFPNVTYANTTSKNAIEICNKLGITYHLNYVTRCYQTRHGNGWMSNLTPVNLINTEEEINTTNLYQGRFRIGELDYDLLNYALKVDGIYSGNSADPYRALFVTCMDQRPGFKFKTENIKSYTDYIYVCKSPKGDIIPFATHFEPPTYVKR